MNKDYNFIPTDFFIMNPNSSQPGKLKYRIVFIVILRILIGWHFLYEGIIKLMDPSWTAYGYLDNSRWIFSSIFRLLADNSIALVITDNLNAWGLVLIGLGLILGLFTRVASIAGACLLALYYIANPPFVGSDVLTEGHYLFIDKNLIEMIALVFLALYPTGIYFGSDNIIYSKSPAPEKVNGKNMKDSRLSGENANCELGRRTWLKSFGTIPLLGLFGIALYRKSGLQGFEDLQLIKHTKVDPDAYSSPTKKLVKFSLSDLSERPMPVGEIKGIKMSRIIIGGNQLNGVAHARDLIYASPLIVNYFTDEKIIETWQIAEACGINTMSSWPSKKFMKVYREYRRRGGRIQWLGHTGPKQNQLKACIDNGAVGIYIAGDEVEKAYTQNKLEDLYRGIELIQQNDVFAGIACHTIKVPMAFENEGIDVDFYMKTLHHDNYWSATPEEKRLYDVRYGGEPDYKSNNKTSWHYYDNMWCVDAGETIEFMKKINKPWIGFKVLAAGAIPPKDGFRYAFANGVDFIHVGVFDFQMVQNANIVINLLAGKLDRERAWMA